MWSLLKIYTFYLIFYLHTWRSEGALITDQRGFERLSLPEELRGSWNLHFCTNDLLNCYEIINPDEMCAYDVTYASACSVQRQRCDKFNGVQDEYYQFPLFESYCRVWWEINWS